MKGRHDTNLKIIMAIVFAIIGFVLFMRYIDHKMSQDLLKSFFGKCVKIDVPKVADASGFANKNVHMIITNEDGSETMLHCDGEAFKD